MKTEVAGAMLRAGFIEQHAIGVCCKKTKLEKTMRNVLRKNVSNPEL